MEALQSATITLDILHKTRIGATVNSLRKSINDPELVTLSKDLIKKWKKLLDKDEANKKAASSAASNGGNSPNISSLSTKSGTKNGTDGKNGASKDVKDSKPEPKPVSNSNSSGDTMTTDQVRIKCRSLIATALKTPFLEGQLDEDAQDDLKEFNLDTLAEDLAAQIEENIFKEFKMTGPKYVEYTCGH